MFISILANNTTNAQPRSDAILYSVLHANKNVDFQDILNHAQTYRCQVIYTQITRDKNNKPSFKDYYFNYDSLLYFNPASTVKMPLAFLALEKLHAIAGSGVKKNTRLQIDSSYPWQKASVRDPTSANGFPSIEHYIKKAFLVSDNDAYNRLYQFIGQQTINRNLHNKGYNDVRITRQFMGVTPDQNRHTNQFRFLKEDGSLLYTQPPAYNTDSFDFSNAIKIGKGHLDKNDSLVNEPFNFTMHNNLSLEDLQKMLQSVLFPGSVSKNQRFVIADTDREFLLQYLSQFPSETNYPKYDTSKYFDSYVKFFFRDSSHKMPPNLRVFNKVGWAYGFMTDVSYVANFANDLEFMLSATLYVNSDGILNDNKYDYESKGYPFLRELGNTIYQFELHRKRAFKPDLSAFNLQYEKRDPDDKRPVISEVDN
ncbi:MAG: class A beta-lactamase-related serine hydrolase [Bacteroidota bacterium]|nr:class A beta-lactamase-related serine hydrolase [Bacteroidota bacterium]